MGELSASPLRDKTPSEIGGVKVTRVKDFAEPEGKLPPSDMLMFELGDEARMLVRPSGTEPKVKIYCDVRKAYADDVAAVRRAGVARAQALIDALLAR